MSVEVNALELFEKKTTVTRAILKKLETFDTATQLAILNDVAQLLNLKTAGDK